MRKTIFANNEYYHIFNRGTDKRNIFVEQADLNRFFQSMDEFNTTSLLGSLYENFFRKKSLGNPSLGNPVSKLDEKDQKLVSFISYCLNPNHYHFILKQETDNGVQKFMHKLGLGYTKYFNSKYQRSGVLFQGGYKAIHISSNEYLLHLSSYVNLNDRVHKINQLGNPVSKSSWHEYESGAQGFCNKDIILSQFNNLEQYKRFAENSLEEIIKRKDLEKSLLE